jgi:hypothetical protein
MSTHPMRDDAPWSPEPGSALMARLAELRSGKPDRRGVVTAIDPAAPGILHIDLAAIAAEVGSEPDEPVVPMSAMETELLEAARKSAAGDATQPPRRELIAVALREVRREEALRDRAGATEMQLRRQLRAAREAGDDLLAMYYELVRWIAAEHGIEANASAVMEFVRPLGRTQPAANAPAADRSGDDGDGKAGARAGAGPDAGGDTRGLRRDVAGSAVRDQAVHHA